MSERDLFGKFTARLAEDKRVYQALLGELTQHKDLFIPAPDCSDIIRNLHLEERSRDVPADACIRHYFDHNLALLLTPAWAYELIEYFHRVIIGNIDCMAGGGTRELTTRYKEAAQFMRLYSAGDLRGATLLYNNAISWKMVLSFTQAENVEHMLRQPLMRLGALIKQKRLKRVVDFDGGENLVEDEGVYHRIFQSISKIRSRPDDSKKNAIDARSIALVYALAERNVSSQSFGAITVTSACREGYYRMLDETGAPSRQYSYVRSPIAQLVKQSLPEVMPADRERYLTSAIEAAENLTRLAREVSYSSVPVGPHLALNEREREAYRKNHRLGFEAKFYNDVFQAPLHRGVPGKPPGSLPSLPRPLSAREALELLESEDAFRKGMARARAVVGDVARETYAYAAPFVRAAKTLHADGKDLRKSVDAMGREWDAL